jgi:hypothetical protein
LSQKARVEFLKSFHCVKIDAVADAGAVNFSFDPAGIFQLLQMLGDGGLRNRKNIHNFSAEAGILMEQKAEDGYPVRVTESPGEAGEFFVFFGLLPWPNYC